MEQRSCGCSQLWHSAPPGMAVGCCELWLRSTPRYRLVCICFPTPGRGLPYGSGLGLSRCLGPGECLHSFIHKEDNVFLILTNFTAIIINTIITMPFASSNVFHVKVINVNSPGSNPKSDHINSHIIINPHTYVFEYCTLHSLHQSN